MKPNTVATTRYRRVPSTNDSTADTMGARSERRAASLSGKLAASTPRNSRSRRRKNRFDSASSRPDSRAVTNDASLSGSNDPLTWSI